MNAYKVYYWTIDVPPTARGDDTEVFGCWADNKEHAKEQVRNAYPEGVCISHVDLLDCPHGGDLANRCEDCACSGDYLFDIRTESCIRRD